MDFDKRIKEDMKNGTNRAAAQKEAVFNAISQRIRKEKTNEVRKSTGKRNSMAVAAVAVLAVLALGAFTPAGRVLANRLIRLFVPEKPIITEVEGQKEQGTGTLVENTAQPVGYVMYIDAQRYTKQTSGGTDIIKAKNFPKNYPPVQMEISQTTKSAKDTYAALLREVSGKYDKVEGKGEVTSPIKGLYIHAIDNGGGEAALEKIYVVDNTRGGCFVIRCKLFLEAEEGHGARFLGMLKTFEVVASDQIEKK